MNIHSSHWKYNRALLLSWDIGAEMESSRQSGFIHLAEHLMFYGTKGISFRDWEDQTYPLFGNIEAKTSQDSLKIICQFHSEDTEKVLKIITQMIHQAEIDEDDIPLLQQEIQDEIDEYKLGASYRYEPIIEKYIPYGHSPLGYQSININYNTCREAQSFLQQLLYRTPVQVYSVGDWSLEEVSLVNMLFSSQDFKKDISIESKSNELEWIVQNDNICIQKRDRLESLEDDIFYFWLLDRAFDADAYFTTRVRQNSVYWILISDNCSVHDIWNESIYQEQRAQAIELYYKNLLMDYDVLDWMKTLERMRYYNKNLLSNKKDLTSVIRMLESMMFDL